MDIRMLGIDQLATIGQQDRLGSALPYRLGRPSPIIGLVARGAGLVAGWSSELERWADNASGRHTARNERAAAR
jgi:hypothetical protein